MQPLAKLIVTGALEPTLFSNHATITFHGPDSLNLMTGNLVLKSFRLKMNRLCIIL